MDIQNFNDNAKYAATYTAADRLSKMSLETPDVINMGTDTSVPALVQTFVNSQSQLTDTLFNIVGQAVSQDVVIDGRNVTPAQQKTLLTNLASKQNLFSRQLEHSLDQHIKLQQGIDSREDLHLINTPPVNFGTEAKVSDTGMRLLTEFSGDSMQNERELTQFFRDIFALAKTGNLTEEATMGVVLRKLQGSANILIQAFIDKQGGLINIKLPQLVGHLERKFLTTCTPMAAISQLHTLQQNSLSYSQLQATVQKLARLACRLENEENKPTLTGVKEISGFIMALSSQDRQFINTENARREGQNLPPLNLDQMTDALIKRQADGLQFSDQYVLQVDHEQIGNVQNRTPVVPQPRGTGRGRIFRGKYTSNRFPTQDQPQTPLNRGRGAFRRGNFRGGGRNGPTNRRIGTKPFVTNAMVGVGRNECLLCGSPEHGFKDEKCPYQGQILQQSPCKHCFLGGHPHSKCLTLSRPPQADNWQIGEM